MSPKCILLKHVKFVYKKWKKAIQEWCEIEFCITLMRESMLHDIMPHLYVSFFIECTKHSVRQHHTKNSQLVNNGNFYGKLFWPENADLLACGLQNVVSDKNITRFCLSSDCMGCGG